MLKCDAVDTLVKENIVLEDAPSTTEHGGSTSAALSSSETKSVEYLAGSKEYDITIFIGNLNYTLRPTAVVIAKTTLDIVNALPFAKEKKVPFTVRGGGHGYGGNCLNTDGIMVDLSEMNEVLLDRDTMTARIQGGAKWVQVYDKLRGPDVDLMVVGGMYPTVGVGGFTLGGGLSAFSRSFGLAIDNVLALTIVTAEGKILNLTNSEKDPSRKNLFWALMGGGGGNFGIITEFTLRVHKLRGQKIVAGELTWPVTESNEAFQFAMDAFNSMKPPDELCMDAFWSFKDGDDTKLQAQMTRASPSWKIGATHTMLRDAYAKSRVNGIQKNVFHYAQSIEPAPEEVGTL
jgi:hypothetical protein